jgi:hypothetical protein
MTAAFRPRPDREFLYDSSGAWTLIDRKQVARPVRSVREILRRVGRVGRAELGRQRPSVGARDLTTILAAVSAVHVDARTWVALDRRAGEPELVFIGLEGSPPSAIVRVARSPAGRSGLARAQRALEALRAQAAGLPATASALPTILAHGDVDGASWLAEVAFSGRSGQELLSDPVRRRAALEATAAAIDAVHAATARETVVGDAEIARWVGNRVRMIGELRAGTNTQLAGREALEGIASSVELAILGRTVTTTWIHGDLWPANVLIDDAAEPHVGIIDWDSAEPDELPLQDHLHLAITSRRIVAHKDLGAVLGDLLRGAPWTPDDRIALGRGSGAASGWPEVAIDDPTGLPSATALWLYWLRFVESNLARHPELGADRGWVAANVEHVLLCA